MKFVDKKTGEIITASEAVYMYCTGNGCEKTCKLYKKTPDANLFCEDWAELHPKEAAKILGYEVIKDRTDWCEGQNGKAGSCPICGSANVTWKPETDKCHCNDCGWPYDMNVKGEEGAVGDPEGPEFENKETSGKLRPSIVPPAAVWNVAAVREWAVANKYHDPEGWRKVPEEQYRDAMFRHMLQEWEEPGSVDKESGLPHLWHMLTNAFFIAQLRSEKHE